MKTLFTVFLVVIISLISVVKTNAQDVQWTKTFGGAQKDGAYAITELADGSIVMAGFSASYSTNHVEDIYLVKTNILGEVVWTKTFGGNYIEIARDLKQTSDGGFIIAGYKQVSAVNDPFLLKTDSLGNLEWEHGYDYGLGMDDRAHAVIQTADGGYFAVGQTRLGTPFPNYDMYVFKTDALGKVEWQNLYRYAEEGNDVALAAIQLSGGDYVFGGVTQSTVWSAYILRVDQLGNVVWSKIRPDDYQSECYDLIPGNDGNIMMSGTSVSFETDTDILIEKIDPATGNLIWEKIYGGEEAELGQSIKEMNDGGFALSCMASHPFTGYDMLVMRTDANGDSLWTTRLGGFSDDRGHAVEVSTDGDIISAGWAYSYGSGGGDVYLAKLRAGRLTGISSFTETPSGFRLEQNYPNPFNPSTNISFSIPDNNANANLTVYDARGNKVAELINENKSQGSYSVNFDGSGLSSGVYFYSLKINGKVAVTKRMMLVK